MTPRQNQIDPRSFAVHARNSERSEAGSTDPRQARTEGMGSILYFLLASTLIVISFLIAGHHLTRRGASGLGGPKDARPWVVGVSRSRRETVEPRRISRPLGRLD
jgi:hypothetical protein